MSSRFLMKTIDKNFEGILQFYINCYISLLTLTKRYLIMLINKNSRIVKRNDKYQVDVYYTFSKNNFVLKK